MQIINVGNFRIRKYGDMRFNVEKKISNGLIRNNWKICEFSDRDVSKFEAFMKIKPLGYKATNKRFIETCENFNPDCIILGACDIITNDTLAEIKKLWPHVKLIYYNVDAPWIDTNINKVKARLKIVDAFFMTSSGESLKKLKTENKPVGFIPNPSDPSVESFDNSQKSSDEFEYDLFYCGGGDKTDSRYPIIIDLHKTFKNKLKFETFGIYSKSAIYGKNYTKVLANSKMSLNLNREEGWYLYSSDRISQLVANGILTFVWDKGNMRKLLSDEHVVYFKDEEELEKKVLEFHNNDQKRKEIASSGREFYHENFSAQKITKFMIETAFNLPYSENYLWHDEVYI